MPCSIHNGFYIVATGVLYNIVPFYKFDGSEGLVHVTQSRVETEVGHGSEGGSVTCLETSVLLHCESSHSRQLMVRGRGQRRRRCRGYLMSKKVLN